MIKVVFLGNPNVGKSALINAMSKSKIRVGNWPGVTVEKIQAEFTYKDQRIELVDLPGTYNFTNTHESKITTEVLLSGDFDLIVNVVDATNLERNLNITLLARELEKPMIVLLNFDDDVVKQGMIIDAKKLSNFLQVPVFKTSAIKGSGINQVLDYIVETPLKKEMDYNIYFDKDIDKCIDEIITVLKEDGVEKPAYGYKFLAIRLFEKEPHYTPLVPEETLARINAIINDGDISRAESTQTQINNIRFKQIKNIYDIAVDKKGVSRYRRTKNIDRIILNKWLGLPIFFLFAVYFLSLIFNVANPLIDWIDGFFEGFIGYHLSNATASWPAWLQSFLIDGILAGVGGVLTFTPLMYFIYLLMALLEESGIMSRIAFIMDRAMKVLGLNGKAFISMIIGFGCTVPAITSTRTLESVQQRKATAMMLPFISCGARLPVYALFGAAFFSQTFGLIVASLYILGLVIAIIVGLVLKALNIYQDDSKESFTIEVPPYRLPEARILFKNVNNRVKGFLKRVVSVIMIVMVFIWAFSYFPNGELKDSYLYRATESVQPIFAPTGFGESDVAIAAIPSAIVAKEAVVGSIKTLTDTEEEKEVEETREAGSIMYQLNELKDAVVQSAISVVTLNISSLFDTDSDEVDDASINAASMMFVDDDGQVQKDSSLRAYSYMVFILLLLPCVVAIATIYKEFGTAFTLKVIALTLVVPYVVSTLIFQIGSLFI